MTAMLLTSCEKPKAAPHLDAFPIHAQKVSPGTVEDTITLVGSIKARDEATLFSRVPGKLKENRLHEGSRVAKDQAVAFVERDEVGVKFEPAPVPSTLSGVVARTYLDRGANVTLDTPIALVLDDSELLAKAEVPERYAGRVALEQDVRVSVEAWPQDSFRGTVSRVSPAVDPATRSAPIEVRITGQGEKLRSGMFAKLTLVMARRAGVLTIPTEAVTGPNADTVFVIENGKAHQRTIQTGLVTDRLTEVRQGLSPGTLVATSGLFALQDGSAVEVLP